MTRLDKCKMLKSKGYNYDPETGKIYGIYGKEIKNINNYGYIRCSYDTISLLGHHFGWYMTYGNVDFDELDHINRDRSDNRICNLRISTRSHQGQNRNDVKGYCWDKQRNKWKSYIMLDQKYIYLGRYNTEEEARNAYLEAKKKYHIF